MPRISAPSLMATNAQPDLGRQVHRAVDGVAELHGLGRDRAARQNHGDRRWRVQAAVRTMPTG